MSGASTALGACPFRVAFDATHRAPDWGFAASCLVFVVIGVVLVLAPRVQQLSWLAVRTPPGFAVIFLAVSCLLTGGSAWSTWAEWSAVQAAEDRGLPIVQGPVEGFHPMAPEGHDLEHFSVHGVSFAYSDYVVVPGFHQSSSHGGPMRSGLQVRIHYVPGDPHPTIIELEVADCRGAEPSSTASAS